jgi:hypothetical protein
MQAVVEEKAIADVRSAVELGAPIDIVLEQVETR